MAELPVRVATIEDYPRVARLMSHVFNETPEPEEHELHRSVYEPDRALLVEDGDAVVAHAAAYTRELTVPGGVVPCAHVTAAGVAATHRRRGMLTALMHRQLREIRDAGREPIAALWASEGRIYPRYGYGSAAPRLILGADTAEVGLPATAPGRLRLGEPTALLPELTKVYGQLRAHRPGWSSRDERWWAHVLADLPARRDGTTELRAVVHEGPDGAVDGYALWRVKGDWRDGIPAGEVWVREVAALDAEAYRALWRLLLSVDLTRTTRFWFAAADEPLLHLVAEPRRLRTQFLDGLWVRVVDVRAALRARRYAAPVDVVLAVTDPLLPGNAGRWRLTGDASGAACEPTADPADLALDVTDLGAAYLGGVGLGSLAAAGRVREETPGALAGADAAFRWHRAPVSPEGF
jgi:predicted acetyltransferase